MAKRTQLSTKDHPSQSKRRCNFDTTDEDFEEFTCGFVPMLGHTQKCVRHFMEWRNERNQHFRDDQVLEDILVLKDKSHDLGESLW